MRTFPSSISLILSGILSVIFVVLVGILIALMQYQARLIEVQPDLTTGQLVYYVNVERELGRQIEQMKGLSQEIATLVGPYNSEQNEVAYRIERLCAIFSYIENNQVNLAKCRYFLSKIPFDGPQEPEGATEEAAVKAPEVVALVEGTPPKSSLAIGTDIGSQIDAIQNQFVEVMGDPMLGKTNLSTIIPIYRKDLEVIADRNQHFWLISAPKYQQKKQQYDGICAYIHDLATKIESYKDVEIGSCADQPSNPPAYSASGAPGRLVPDAASSEAVADPEPQSTSVAAAAPGTTATGSTAAGATAEYLGLPPGIPQVTLKPGRLLSVPSIDVSAEAATEPAAEPLPPVRPVLSADQKQRIFDLVSSYRFYQGLTPQGVLEDILISPSDFLAFLLVCFGGILGALLRIVFHAYVSGKDASFRNLLIGPILGLICALVVYTLLRAGFIAITDRPDDSTSMLSPFFIAVVSMAAGLLSERAVDTFTRTTGSWLGSVEASQASRWASRLNDELIAKELTVEKLAERVDVSAAKLREWADEKSVVPMDKQREIALVLNVPLRAIFTDIPPPVK